MREGCKIFKNNKKGSLFWGSTFCQHILSTCFVNSLLCLLYSRDHRSELNNTKMKYDGKVAVMNEEIAALKAQASKYRRLVIKIFFEICFHFQNVKGLEMCFHFQNVKGFEMCFHLQNMINYISLQNDLSFPKCSSFWKCAFISKMRKVLKFAFISKLWKVLKCAFISKIWMKKLLPSKHKLLSTAG